MLTRIAPHLPRRPKPPAVPLSEPAPSLPFHRSLPPAAALRASIFLFPLTVEAKVGSVSGNTSVEVWS